MRCMQPCLREALLRVGGSRSTSAKPYVCVFVSPQTKQHMICIPPPPRHSFACGVDCWREGEREREHRFAVVARGLPGLGMMATSCPTSNCCQLRGNIVNCYAPVLTVCVAEGILSSDDMWSIPTHMHSDKFLLLLRRAVPRHRHTPEGYILKCCYILHWPACVRFVSR